MKEIFTNIPKIQYEGKDSKNPFAFKFYDAERVVLGKKMKEHLPFAMAWWHNLCAAGTDMFGRDTADKAFGAEKGTMEHAKAKVDAGFEFMQKLGIEYFCFHDVDLAPEAEDIKETNRRLDEITDYILEKMKGTNIKCLWGTANMFSNPRFMNGAGSTNSAEVFCFAAAQVKKALDLTVKLGGRGYVFWGGREGYETLLNTDMKFEQENIARLMKMAVAYGRSIGFTGDFYIEPKPKEPMKHQYDFDAATAIGFLRQYGLDQDFKLNIEANHATLAGHTFQHELRVSAINGMLGSIDANQGDMLLGWDTDEFPSDVYSATLCMYEVLKAGGLTGGFNFDSKNRRPSNTYEDMFHAFILGMDTFALGLIKAAAIIEDGRIDAFVKERYASFESEIGKEILHGTTLQRLAAYAEKLGSTCEPASGRQEYLNGIVNSILFTEVNCPQKIIKEKGDEGIRLSPGMKKQLPAKAMCGDKELCVTYISSDESVAKVDEKGIVTAVSEGYAVITAGVDECCLVDYAVTVVPEKPYVHTSISNPYLPIWEHIPDGEPYVFEDPDNLGKYRVYVYGSHDTKLTHYCGYEQVLWSAPVEDLTRWTYHGEIFRSTVNGTRDTLYAPDVAEVIAEDGTKTYYFYPNNQSGGRRSMVAKANRPDGPFVVCNWLNDNRTLTEGPLGFDVAVLYDGGKAYGYWGFENHEDSSFAELDTDTMATVKSGTGIRRNLPTRTDINQPDYDPSQFNVYQDEYVNMWGFFEAPSIRKVGNKYILLFSRRGLASEPWGCNTYQLAYGYSDSPEGPWKWGGIVVDAGGEAVPKTENKYARTFPADNTHGSICEINGQWYIFYHRANNRFSRQSTVDTVNISWDEKLVSEGGGVRITMAEMTSKGFHIDGLEPFRKYPASIACFLTGGSRIEAVYDRSAEIDPVIISGPQSIVGIKYLIFDKRPDCKKTSLAITVVPCGADATVDVYFRPTTAANTEVVRENGQIVSVGKGSIKAGSFNITGDMKQSVTEMKIPFTEADELVGEWGLFFVFTSESKDKICEFHSFEFFM